MINNNPLVTVIVPTFNRPLLLHRTLNSIVKQTYHNLEILVVSNGVNDNNRAIVEEIADSRIKYLSEEKNSGGPSIPRNRGIEKAKGKYVAFCDDDDLWLPEKISKQVNALEDSPEYGLCYTKMMRFNDEREWSVSHEEGQANLDSLLYVNTVPISSVIIRQDCLKSYGGFSESKKIGSAEDYEFLLRYATITKFYFIDEYLIKYWSGNARMTENQMSIKKLFNYLSHIFYCYLFLWKMKKIKLSKLIIPLLYNLALFFKGFIYQVLVKLNSVKLRNNIQKG